MKKELLSLLFVLILAAASQAAPSQFTTTGFMGIKTDDPQHALDIEGATKSHAVEYPDGTFQIGAGSRDNLGYQITTATLSSETYSATAPIPMGLRFKPDGTRFFTIDWTDDIMHQHSCTTPWTLSSCSYDLVNLSTQDASPRGLFVSPKGHKVYEVGYGTNNIYQYDCNTNWDLSSCSHTSGKDLDISGEETQATGLYFKPDGKYFLLIGLNTDRIREYTCETAWEVDSCSPTGTTLYVNAEENNPEDVLVINGGKQLLTTGQQFDKIHRYDCSKSWNLSSCSYTSVTIDAQDAQPGALEISPDGTMLFELGWGSDTIRKYEFGLYTSGELGIGTENPQAAVDVDGAIEQSNAYFHAYDATGGIAITTSWTNITWDTEVREDTMYTHAADSEIITISSAGWYLIKYECTIDVDTGAARYTVNHRLLADGTELAGTRASSYHRDSTNGRDSVSITRLYETTGSTEIHAEAILLGLSSGESLTTEPDGCSITIERI